MINIFNKIWPKNTALESPKVFSIGYHTHSFTQEQFDRLEQALEHADKYLLSKDRGPVVYVTATELKEVFPF